MVNQERRMAAETYRLDGRVILITGAGRGLGESYARHLAGLGAQVIVNDLGAGMADGERSPLPARRVAEAIRAAGGRASDDMSDIADPREAEALVERIVEVHGRIDALVNNAGNFLPPAPFAETALADFERTWRIHLGGTYNLCRAALPHMTGQGFGRIVNTISTQGLYGGVGTAAYASAKAAVQGLTASLAADHRGSDVRINAISPGAFTRMVDAGNRPAAFTEALKRNLPADLVAPAVAWLCHPACAENGALIQAMSGWFSRTIIGDLDGFWDFAPSIDSVARGLAALPATGPVRAADSSAAHAQSIIARAEAARAHSQEKKIS
ncbi:short-chain dehydrogenase [Rhizorhabdus wittichii DC-6]|nr:short-chain dehydrogenase [Rhizorhabdus wittichii DC-6]